MSAELNWGKSNLEVHLKLKGGWGMENLTGACGWIANGVRWRTAKNSTFVIHTGRGFADNIEAVLEGTVDFAFTTPIVAADMALKGRGIFDTSHPNLRAVAVLPHRDRLVFAVDAEVADRYDLRTFRDFVTKCPPLRIATALNDGGNFVGYSVARVLNAYGMSWEDLEQWGGQWLTAETPRPAISWFANGDADALFHEAIMVWPRFIGQKLLRLLPIELAVLEQLHEQYDYRRADIEPGDFVGVEEPVPTLDFSQWLLVTREEVPDELVNLVTNVLVEDREIFESRYRQQPLKQSPLYYPIQPEAICQTGSIPLHSGADRYYREHGLLE
ncbi:MAG: hypothetical protein JOZ78_04280 [Chroococcidiopsidaceae cyanobacterium CP_BM_ER_R8_30]|nr:hypothetical protein [Chroococcidiopsidaceae cyanobacterium CP_BM_ER_R8_30]